MAEVTPGVVTPEVPAAPVETTPAPESTADQGTETPEGVTPETPDEKMLPQSEVNKIIAKRVAQATRQAERLASERAEALYYKRLYEQTQQQKPPEPQGEPKPTDFKDYDTYNRALIRYEMAQVAAKQREDTQRETSTQQQHRQMVDRAAYMQQNLFAKGEAKYNDFREVVMGEVPITEAMAEAAARLPNGADVLYQLAQDPAEVMRIAQLSPIEQVWEFKDLASKLTATPKPTDTPPPIVPNSGKTSVRKSTFDLNIKNDSEWKEYTARRRKELGRR